MESKLGEMEKREKEEKERKKLEEESKAKKLKEEESKWEEFALQNKGQLSVPRLDSL